MTKAEIVAKISEKLGIEKTGRNISKNTTITIPAHNIPAFKPAKVFVQSIKTKVKVKEKTTKKK